jgi:hypothetical protein
MPPWKKGSGIHFRYGCSSGSTATVAAISLLVVRLVMTWRDMVLSSLVRIIMTSEAPLRTPNRAIKARSLMISRTKEVPRQFLTYTRYLLKVELLEPYATFHICIPVRLGFFLRDVIPLLEKNFQP